MEKQRIREAVWRLLEEQKVSRFPGAHGRIPNFVGTEAAAALLGGLGVWRLAKAIKANPDFPQRPVRRLALEQGKRVYMAVPRLRSMKPFIELDPARLQASPFEVSSIGGASRAGRPVGIDELPPIDLIVCGSVAVTMEGARLGKGGGYSDLEFGLLTEAGKVSKRTIILTTVHPLQIVKERFNVLPHDISVDVIVTPDEVFRVPPRYPRPKGIYWDLLTEEKLVSVPLLTALRPIR